MIAKDWKALCAAAKLNGVRIHDCRHTYASLAVSGGESLPIVGALLGHSRPDTTQRYSHLADSPLRQAKGEKLSAAECRDLPRLLDNPEPRRRGNPHRDAAKRQELIAARLVVLDLRGQVEVEKSVQAVAEQENVDRATVYRARRRWFGILRAVFQKLPSEGWDAYIASLEADQ